MRERERERRRGGRKFKLMYNNLLFKIVVPFLG